MGVIRAWLALMLSMAPVQAQSLLCLMDGAMMVAEGEQAQFDYFGGGTFDLSAPIPSAGFGAETLYLSTATDRVPVILQERQCLKLQATLPVTVEVIVRSADGPFTFSGCCLWRTAP